MCVFERKLTKNMKTNCTCNTHGFGAKSMCSMHSEQLRQQASGQIKLAYKWFKIAEQYMQACTCDGSCEICNDFNKAARGE
jgi:hypothetical protein